MMVASLQIPAMRGAMGDWIYYVTLLPFQEVCARIKKTEEVHSSRLLRDMIQRALTSRSRKIAAYLRSQPQRFFNAIVVGVYEGEPQWHGLSVKKSDLFNPSELMPRVSDSLGILTLRGDEKLFAIDGQHRVEGIKEFAKEMGAGQMAQLEDEICVIFVAHSNKPAGMQRTRRLFATLNRYAKPVSLTEIIALDEDDVVAIACRDLLENHSLFKNDRISLEKRKSLAPNDDKNFTSLMSLYQAMDEYLMDAKRADWQAFKSVRPSDDDRVQFYIDKAHHFWDLLVGAIPELSNIQKLKPGKPLPRSLRGPDGGDLLFRPIAPPMIARCLRKAGTFGMDEETFISRFAKTPRRLNKHPWMHLLWDGMHMIVREKNRTIAEDIILWMVNCDPKESKIKELNIRKRLAVVTNQSFDECRLPHKVA